MGYLGNSPQNQAFTPAIDYFSGNGSTTAFTLSRPVASVAQVQAVIENVPQNPGDAYTVSGNTITFTSAPPSGTNNIYVYYTSPITQVIQPGQGTVGTAQIANGVTVSFADGSAAAPSITNVDDSNTGIFFPAADTIAFAEGGTESMRLDSTGDVNLYNAKSFKVYNPANTRFGSFLTNNDGTVVSSFNGSGEPLLLTSPTGYFTVSTNGSERMRIDSNGKVLVNATSSINGDIKFGVHTTNGGCMESNGTVDYYPLLIYRNGNLYGTIYQSGTSTAYNTSSDYRLKENIAPMTGALAVIGQLKPCTYTWKETGEDGQGFIAHELQEVCPDAVTGEKDAVETYTDEDGNEQTRIKPQGIDTSFLVATLTAAIQEQQALITHLQADVAELKGAK